MRLKTFEKELSLDENRYISHTNNLIRNIDYRFDYIFSLNIPDFISLIHLTSMYQKYIIQFKKIS